MSGQDECNHDYENAKHVEGTFKWECPLCRADISIGYVLYFEAVSGVRTYSPTLMGIEY